MFITVDIGGTKTKFVTFDNLNPDSILNRKEFSTNEIKNYKSAIEKISITALEMAGSNAIDAIGLSITGSVDPTKGMVLDSIFLPEWNNRPLVKDLNSKLNSKITIENDAVAAALAELSNINLESVKNYTFIAIGTGLGAARIIKFSNSILVFPWDFGHMIMEKDGVQCPCGQKGCLEMYSSGSGIEARYGKKLEDINDPAVWKEMTDYIAVAISTYLNINITEKFVFGGGISFKRTGIVDDIQTKVKKYGSYPMQFPQFELSRYQQESQPFGMLQLMAPNKNIVNMNFY